MDIQIWMYLTYFGFLEFTVMRLRGFLWLHLNFSNLQSCILGVFIDCIWNFSQIFSRFYWLQLEFLYLQSNIFLNCMTAFELFKICGQLGALFLMTYLEILHYAVNLSLYTEVLHCTILKSITFPPPLFNFIIFPGKNAPQYMESPR